MKTKWAMILGLLAIASCKQAEKKTDKGQSQESETADMMLNRHVAGDSLELRAGYYYYLAGDEPYSGRFSSVDEQGDTTLTGAMHKGVFHGKWTFYYANGKEKARKYFDKGRPVGHWESYAENGQLSMVEQYNADGEKHGEYKTYTSEGKPIVSGRYEDGYKVGAWTWNHPEGKGTFTRNYTKPPKAKIDKTKVNITSMEQAEAVRQKLIAHVWGAEGWPARRSVDKTEEDIAYIATEGQMKGKECYKELYGKSLKQINRYQVQLDHGFVSNVHHFVPVKPNGKVFIYHPGHSKSFQYEDEHNNAGDEPPGHVIPTLLEQGYDVVTIMMPLTGNPTPTPEIEGYGPLELPWGTKGHNVMFTFLERPYRYFFEPIVATVNYMEGKGFDTFYMMGLSGGGWTTTLYAALDPRIQYSFPVAGTVPIYLRDGSSGDYGDAEQGYYKEYDPGGLYDMATYKDLYLLGAAGKGRVQVQILNEHDDCCFYGLRYPKWVDQVKAGVGALGQGRYDFFLDQSHQTHRVSKQAVKVILATIEGCEYELGNKDMIARTAKVGQEYAFQPEVSISQACKGGRVTFSLPINPGWLSIDPQTGYVSGTPGKADKGKAMFSIKVVSENGGFLIENMGIEVE